MDDNEFCSSSEMILISIHSFIAIGLYSTLIYCVYKFVTNISKEKVSKTNKILAICFLIITALAIPSHAVYVVSECCPLPQILAQILIPLRSTCYAIQLYLALILFFSRLLSVFAKTKFRLSLAVTRFYKCFWIFFPLLTTFLWTLSFMLGMQRDNTWKLICAMTGMVLLVSVMISLVVLYIFKLLQVHKSLQFENDTFLVNAITKTTILTSTSIIMTLNCILILGVSQGKRQGILGWTQLLFTTLNIWTNFACVILYYQQFKSMYAKCSCLDDICNKCWSRIVARDAVMLSQMMKTSETKTSQSMSGDLEIIDVDIMQMQQNETKIDIGIDIEIESKIVVESTTKDPGDPEISEISVV